MTEEERVARALHAEAQSIARDNGTKAPLPTYDEDDEETRLVIGRMARAAITALRSSREGSK